LNKLLEDGSYLSDEEKTLKQKFEESIRLFHEIYEDLPLIRNKLELDGHNHFQEIRFQIDEHREQFTDFTKTRIDDIALKMVEKTKLYEALYVKSLNEKLENTLTSFGGKSLEKDLKEMEAIFRSTTPFFRYILTSRQQTKQKEALADLQVKLKEMNQIAIDLIASNEFKPSFSIDRDLFGLLHSNRDANSDLFKSQILAGNQTLDLMKLCEFNP